MQHEKKVEEFLEAQKSVDKEEGVEGEEKKEET